MGPMGSLIRPSEQRGFLGSPNLLPKPPPRGTSPEELKLMVSEIDESFGLHTAIQGYHEEFS